MSESGQARRMVVVEERPGRKFAIAMLLPVLVGLIFYAGWEFGLHRSSDGGVSGGRVAEAAYESLQASHGALEAEVLALQRQLADIELGQVVDSHSTEQLRQTMKTMGDQHAEIEEEVRFYRQLMAPSEAQRGLRVEKLDLIRSEEGDDVEYRLLLTQVVDRHEWLRGEVNFDVIGSAQGTQQVLSLTELSKPEAYPLEFRFRYFQDFTGTLELPADFEAERVVVTAVSSGRKGKQIQRTFSWDLQPS